MTTSNLLPEVPSTSLVLSIKTMDGVCQRRTPQLMVCVEQPHLSFLTGCGAFECLVCGPKKVHRQVAALAQVVAEQPRARFITLTQAPEAFEPRRQKMADMARWAKKVGIDWNVVWTTERGSQTGMVHIHAIQWGSFVPQGVLQERWGAIADIRAIKSQGTSVAAYMAKGAAVARYMAKGTAQVDYPTVLELNVRRHFRWSRGFFSGRTWEECARLHRRNSSTQGELTWRPGTVEEALQAVEAARLTRPSPDNLPKL